MKHAIKASSRVANFCGKVIFLVWLGMKLCTWMVRVFAQLRSTTELGLLGEMRQLRRTRAAGYHRSFTTHDDKSHTLTLALEFENQKTKQHVLHSECIANRYKQRGCC